MRVVKEIFDLPCKLTIFSWNGKFLIKLEHKGLEQTYKVSELDVLEEELDEILTDDFLSSAMNQFDMMAQNFGNALSKL